MGDAQAALGITHRNGLGKPRHIQIGLLSVQQVAVETGLMVGKALGNVNPADLYTKYLGGNSIFQHAGMLECEFAGGRALDAFQFHSVSASIDNCKLMGVCSNLGMTECNHRSNSTQQFKARKVQQGRRMQGRVGYC